MLKFRKYYRFLYRFIKMGGNSAGMGVAAHHHHKIYVSKMGKSAILSCIKKYILSCFVSSQSTVKGGRVFQKG